MRPSASRYEGEGRVVWQNEGAYCEKYVVTSCEIIVFLYFVRRPPKKAQRRKQAKGESVGWRIRTVIGFIGIDPIPLARNQGLLKGNP
jgi:hypothetical protein